MSARFRGGRPVPSSVLLPRVVFALATLAMVLFGLVMVYSSSMTLSSASSSVYFVNQLTYVGLGLVCCAVCYLIPSRAWRGRFVWVVWFVGLALLVATAVLGSSVSETGDEMGARRWLSIAGHSLQPSEFEKIALVLMAARILADYREGLLDGLHVFIEVAVLILVPIILIVVFQSDAGTLAIMLVGLLALMWIGEVPYRPFLVVGALGVAFVVLYVVSEPYRLQRFTTFLFPFVEENYNNETVSTWQLGHSLYAFAEGGLFGVGLGNSMAKYGWLSQAQSDFIYAVIGEELGIVGAVAVPVLFLVFLFSGLLIAFRARTSHEATIAGGLVTMIAFQAFLNMLCVVGLAPTTGKPLPFFSQGGSSMIASLIMVGLVLGVSREAGLPSVYERRRDDLRIVRAAGGGARRTAQARR